MAKITTVKELSDQELDKTLLDIFEEETDGFELNLTFNKDFSQETLKRALTLKNIDLNSEELDNAYKKIQDITEDLMVMLWVILLKNKKIHLTMVDGNVTYNHSDLSGIELFIPYGILVDLLYKLNKSKKKS